MILKGATTLRLEDMGFRPSVPKLAPPRKQGKITRNQKNHIFLHCARLRGRTAMQRSKKGSEKVLGRVLGKGFSEGFWEGGLLWVLQ